jgi:hypothetical protein
MTSHRKSLEDMRCFYTLFTDDDGVVGFDRLVEARKAKRNWSKTCAVKGPFEHYRVELPLIVAARKAIRLLSRIRNDEGGAAPAESNAKQVAKELRTAIGKCYPFKGVSDRRLALINRNAVGNE